MKYILTPEFHRNLWLKFSPFRLIAAPVFIGVMAAICVKILPGEGLNSFAYKSLLHVSLWFYFLVVVIWGNYEAGTAMQEEMKGNTWDFQRMSSVTAFQLVIGKLFGATSYIWYIGLLTLIPFYVGLANVTASDNASIYFEAKGWGENSDIYVVLYLILAGLLGHSLAFLASFVDLTSFLARTGKKRIPRGSGAFAMGVVVSWWVFATAQSVTPKLAVSTFFREFNNATWFGNSYSTTKFATFSFLFFLFWFLLGSYRIARAELMHRIMPVAWMAFVVSLLGYFYGFSNPESAYYFGNLMAIFILSVFLAYAAMIFEASDSRKYSRFFSCLKQRNFLRSFENAHKWMVSVPFVVICFVLTLKNVPETGKYISFASMFDFMLAIILFAIRDGLVIHAALAGKGSRSTGFKIVFYYLMAYVLLPFLHFAFMSLNPQDLNIQGWIRAVMNGGGDIDQLVPDVVKSLALYYPLPLANMAASVGPVQLEVVAAAIWLLLGIQSRRDKREQSSKVIANPKG